MFKLLYPHYSFSILERGFRVKVSTVNPSLPEYRGWRIIWNWIEFKKICLKLALILLFFLDRKELFEKNKI